MEEGVKFWIHVTAMEYTFSMSHDQSPNHELWENQLAAHLLIFTLIPGKLHWGPWSHINSITIFYNHWIISHATISLPMCTFQCWQYKVYSVLSLELSRFWQIYGRTDGHYGLKADKRQFRALLTHLHKLSAVQHCAECNSDYSFFIAAYFLLSKEPAVHSNKWLPLPRM